MTFPNMQQLFVLSIAGFVFGAGQALASDTSASTARNKYRFDPEWKASVGDVQGAQALGCDDGTWKTVALSYA